MDIIKYRSFDDLQYSAKQHGIDIFETGVSWSFRVFENRQTKEFHVFYKPERQSNWIKYNHRGEPRTNKSK